MRGNAPCYAAIGFGEEQLCFAMLEPRILAQGDQRVDFILEWRHPVGIAGVKAERQVDKGPAVGLCEDGADGGCGHTKLRAPFPNASLEDGQAFDKLREAVRGGNVGDASLFKGNRWTRHFPLIGPTAARWLPLQCNLFARVLRTMSRCCARQRS